LEKHKTTKTTKQKQTETGTNNKKQQHWVGQCMCGLMALVLGLLLGCQIGLNPINFFGPNLQAVDGLEEDVGHKRFGRDLVKQEGQKFALVGQLQNSLCGWDDFFSVVKKERETEWVSALTLMDLDDRQGNLVQEALAHQQKHIPNAEDGRPRQRGGEHSHVPAS